MGDFELSTPVAMLVFNRPEQTARVFAAVRGARPPVLLVVADGPRAERPEDARKCARTRQIFDGIDWPCEVRRNFAESNLGCKGRVSSGLNWVFEQVEEAIVLEDDCLPHATFFRFCQELLAHYRGDPRVYMICGHNFLRGQRRSEESYYFSRYAHVWGWASWRRSWQLYDAEMKLWPALRDEGWLLDLFGNRQEADYWTGMFEMTYTGEINTWDYQMFLTAWSNNMLTVIPNGNLIANIGFGPEATHTRSDSLVGEMAMEGMGFHFAGTTFGLPTAR